jgi:hypothetical protein
LAVARPHLVQPIFSPRAVARLRAIARELPGYGLAALEARLAPGLAPENTVVDLSFRLRNPSEARGLARTSLPAVVHEFLARWSRPEGPFARVPAVWLELDLDVEAPASGALLRPSLCARLPAEADPAWLADVLLPALTGEPVSLARRSLLLRCLAEIPSPACPLYLFGLLPREGNPVRLEIFGLDPDGIKSYLRRLAPGAAGRAAEAAALLAGVERLHLSFDLGEEILPRIGIEGSFPKLPKREPRWAELFSRLVEHGLCAPEKRDAVLAWPGYDSFWTAPERWPAEVEPGGFCARGLSHVKLVSQPDRALEAKVYLLVERLERSDRAELKAPG